MRRSSGDVRAELEKHSRSPPPGPGRRGRRAPSPVRRPKDLHGGLSGDVPPAIVGPVVGPVDDDDQLDVAGDAPAPWSRSSTASMWSAWRCTGSTTDTVRVVSSAATASPSSRCPRVAPRSAPTRCPRSSRCRARPSGRGGPASRRRPSATLHADADDPRGATVPGDDLADHRAEPAAHVMGLDGDEEAVAGGDLADGPAGSGATWNTATVVASTPCEASAARTAPAGRRAGRAR